MTLLKSILFTSCLFCVGFQVYGLDVSVTSLTYYHNGPYVEIYSRVLGQTARFVSAGDASSNHTAQIEYLILVEQGADIKIAEKFNIQSQQDKTANDFWDRRRYKLEPGTYNLSLQYVDLNNSADTLTHTEIIEVENEEITMSDLMLLNAISSEAEAFAFEKAGVFYEPLSHNIFGTDDNAMYFMTELNIPQGTDQLYYKYQIIDRESLRAVTKPGFKKVDQAEELILLLDNLAIDDLASGYYIFQVELINKDKETLRLRSQDFTVYHPLVDYRLSISSDDNFENSFVHDLEIDEVIYGLKAIVPRLGNNRISLINEIIDGENEAAKRYFLYQYWAQYSMTDPKAVYDTYMEVAYAIDLEFANNVGHGFETDRGYIFLKYGKPSDIINVEDEPSAPPYQIWLYNHLVETNQTAVKFLFYNSSLVSNDYTLLHSTCRGEINNPQWEIELYRDDPRTTNDNDLNGRSVQDGYNRNARRYFEDF